MLQGMDPFQIRQAIREVRTLKQTILEKQRFRGYSGRARALGGFVALAAGLLLQLTPWGTAYHRIFAVWGLVFLIAASLNYGSLVYWLLRGREPFLSQRVPQLIETFCIWFVTGTLTFVLWRQAQADLLYGLWMLLFGLAQVFNRTHLPKGIGGLGAYYMVCGALCLWFSPGLFALPLVMGTVFFFGEFCGGLIFHLEGDLHRLPCFFGLEPREKEVSS